MPEEKLEFLLVELLPVPLTVIFKVFLEGKIVLRKSDSKFKEGEIINIYRKGGVPFFYQNKEFRVIHPKLIYTQEEMRDYIQKLKESKE